MQEHFDSNQKENSETLDIRRRQVEKSSYLTDSNLEKYEKSTGIDFSKLKGKTILDIGSGANEKFSKEAEKLGIKVFSLNPKLKKGISGDEFLRDWKRLSVAARGQEMPLRDNSFDYEIALFSVPFYLPLIREEYEALFKEVIRTLKPGGQAYFCPILQNYNNNYTPDTKGLISTKFVSEILDQFPELITYKMDSPGGESRLVITKKNYE